MVMTPFKIASLNCAGLKSHFQDVQSDDTILKLEIIHLIETSLEENEESPLNIGGYEAHILSVGNGKGIATYYKTSIYNMQQDYITPTMQITKFCTKSLDIINVYRSNKGNSVELLKKLQEMLTPGISTLISEDFNICQLINPNNRMSKALINTGFQQLVNEPTHILGGHIDHVYWNSRNKEWEDPILNRHSAYYSDHDAMCITMNRQVTFLE